MATGTQTCSVLCELSATICDGTLFCMVINDSNSDLYEDNTVIMDECKSSHDLSKGSMN